MPICVEKCLFKTWSRSFSRACTISVLRHHIPVHALKCLQMCAQSDLTCDGRSGSLMVFTLSASFKQLPDTCLNVCIAKAQRFVRCCCAKCLIVTHRLLTVPSCACILKSSLSCPAPAEQAPSQFPVQYTHKDTSVLSWRSYYVISRLSWLR